MMTHCICRTCGKEFTADLSSSKGRFCSRACYWHGKEPRTPLADRFWAKVEKTADGCWLWTGSRDRKGYGRIGLGPRQGTALAHRVAWELTYGPIPAGLHACHVCDNPPCVRPDHLFLGTQAVNMADMAAKGRSLSGDRNVLRRRPDLIVRGSDHPKAKLDETQALQIRQMYASGHVRMIDLAAQFGVSLTLIHKVIHRKGWTHVR